MIGGVQGHQNGDAAWHREQRKHEVNRGDIKLAIDMLNVISDDPQFECPAEYITDTLENCGNRIAKLESILQECLNDICSARLCSINSMSSRNEMMRLMGDAVERIKKVLNE